MIWSTGETLNDEILSGVDAVTEKTADRYAATAAFAEATAFGALNEIFLASAVASGASPAVGNGAASANAHGMVTSFVATLPGFEKNFWLRLSLAVLMATSCDDS